MNALAVLYGGSLSKTAFEPLWGGKHALTLALERAAAFPGTGKVLLLAAEDFDERIIAAPFHPQNFELIRRERWTQRLFLDTVAAASSGYDLCYVAWADCPLLDGELAGAVADRHLRYKAEYSYADGWPYGFAPEILAPATAGILAKILGDDQSPVERDTLFQVIQKDINAFDIETEISAVDLRTLRLSLSADSRRNHLLLSRLMEAGVFQAADAEAVITGQPELLRTLPRFYAVQVSGPCPRACSFCPYPQFGAWGDLPVTQRNDFLEPARFEALLEGILAFSGDAVIDLSLWGELSLHPNRFDLIRAALSRPDLSVVIETSGLGWNRGELEALALLADTARQRRSFSAAAPLSWIISLEDTDAFRGIEPGGTLSASVETAKILRELFPQDAYVQAIRTAGREDAIERFYRSWKEAPPSGGSAVIIQKYDNFCGTLPDKRASDLSPIHRQPCWHLMRDMNILIDGRVPVCREELAALTGAGGRILGNVYTDDLAEIWERGRGLYREQCNGSYTGLCAECDEYYTFNF